MAASDLADRFVSLQGGVVVPAAAYVLLLNLETRGLSLSMDGQTLVVAPPASLTRDDCAAIRQWKRHLVSLMEYSQRRGLDAHLFTDRTTRETGIERRTA